MNFIHIDVLQGTEAWHQARAGIPTASRAQAVQAHGRKNGEEAITRRDYRIQIATEQITGSPQDESLFTPWMEQGKEFEPDAARAYEVEGELLLECGFCRNDDAYVYGCSPDRRVGEWHGLVGFKCPKPATHVRYVTENRLPPAYLWQVVQEMLVVDTAEWFDFCSYCPAMPEGLTFWKVRIERAELEPEMRNFRVAIKEFIDDVADTVLLLKKLQARNT